MSYDKKFMSLKGIPPTPSVPKGANYILYRRRGKILTLAGNGPLIGEKIPKQYVGKLGKSISTKQGYKAARLTGMNLLLVARDAIKTLDRVDYILNIDGSVNSSNKYFQQPEVINGCSDLMVEIFGMKGRHTRSALGTNTLAFNICVEISMTIVIK